MTDRIKLNITQLFGDVADTDRLIGYPSEGFSVVDGPAADAAARANPPRHIPIGRIKAYAGAFVNAGEQGRIYTHANDVWLCITSTTDQPAPTNVNWLSLGNDIHYRGAWLAGRDYKVGNVVLANSEFYRCLRDHTSSDNLEQDVDQDRWLRDSFPDYMTADSDALGINTAPDAVIHAFSYDGHTHGSNLAKLERYGDGDVYLSVATNGEERGRFSFLQHDGMAIETVDNIAFRFAIGANYVKRVRFNQNDMLPENDNQYRLGSASKQFFSVMTKQINAVRTFDTVADRDVALPAPVEGQLTFTGERLDVRHGMEWVHVTPPVIDSLLDLTDTPASFGGAGSRLVVGRDRMGMVWEAGPIPPQVRDGWTREQTRDFVPTHVNDATNFLQVSPVDSGDLIFNDNRLLIGSRYIAAPQGVVIPPYGGQARPMVFGFIFDPTMPLANVGSINQVTNAPRYHHGNSQGTLAQYQRAGLAVVEWGGTEYRLSAYFDPHTRRPYFAFSTTSLFNSMTFGAAVAGDVMFNLGENHDELYSIAVPSPDESHLQDYEIYALVLNKILRIRFNNDPAASSLLTSDHDTLPQVTTVAEFTRHADQEDIGARKYFVGEHFDGTRSRGLEWHDNVLFWATNLGIFAIDSYSGQRITELDTTWNDVGGYPDGLDNQTMDAAGLAWYGDYVYLLYHRHNGGTAATNSHIRAYRWQGDPVGRFATQPAATGAGGLPTAQQGVLPSWVVLTDAEQSLTAPILRTNRIRNAGVDRTQQQQFVSRASGVVDLQIGDDLHTYKLNGHMLGDFLPAGIGLYDIGQEGASAIRTTFTENVRAHTISPRQAYDVNNADTTGLKITDVTKATGNFESVRVFPTAPDRTLAIPAPFVGQLSFIELTEIVEMWDGNQWLGIGGEHAGAHADLSQVASDIIPLLHLEYDLGSRDRRWQEGHFHTLYTASIETEDDGGQGILSIGTPNRGQINVRGVIDFVNADVRHVATSITHSLLYATGGLQIRLLDEGGVGWQPSTTVSAVQLGQSLLRIDAPGLPAAGKVLTVSAAQEPSWEYPIDTTEALQVARFVANTGGTVARTAFGFDGNDNTGIYSPAVNNVGIVCGGEERVRIDHHGTVIPNPLNVLNDNQPVQALGQDTLHHRWDVFGGVVNYQSLQQASGIDRKFGKTAADLAATAKVHDLQVVSFRYKDRPDIAQLGVVLEELPPEFLATRGTNIDLSAVLYATVQEVQRLRQQVDWLEGKVAGNFPAFVRNSERDAGRGVPPAGWNVDGTRQQA